MKTRIEIRSIGGSVLFSHEEENNSVKRTLEAAVKIGADLRFANLYGANLCDANLSGVYLSGAKIPMYCKWDVYIVDGNIKVGCETKSPSEWMEWLEGDEEFETKRGTDDFKRIEACIRAHCVYLETLNK